MTPAALSDLLAAKRLLIFDLDGTLVDSSPLHARAFEDACAPFGIAVDYSDIAGMTTETAIDRLTDRSGVTLTDDQRRTLIADKRLRARTLIETELAAIPGAPAFLRAAGGRWRRSLCTSASRGNATAALAKAGIADCFEWTLTADDVTRGKPDPEMFLAALDLAGVPAAEALVFEDAPNGLAAASAAGIDAIEIVLDAPEPGTNQATWAMLNDALAATGVRT
ncbi:hypothetical protein ASE86_14285 [Sphingomonas sp. Leaf33]|uniref:HAD family hydrolase n=1 Tax=Sphingomonas sp. Leaf33 TaxID=1736215 RepID=UPI00070127CF|nr:HAD family phosphatase [Sphingomonas sp. Leaf33]KQN22942.1 hypothetical protein ASE86_14285 [Sphingomonas sp. Leaf33]